MTITCLLTIFWLSLFDVCCVDIRIQRVWRLALAQEYNLMMVASRYMAMFAILLFVLIVIQSNAEDPEVKMNVVSAIL